jgi:hypothetical protein
MAEGRAFAEPRGEPTADTDVESAVVGADAVALAVAMDSAQVRLASRVT